MTCCLWSCLQEESNRTVKLSWYHRICKCRRDCFERGLEPGSLHAALPLTSAIVQHAERQKDESQDNSVSSLRTRKCMQRKILLTNITLHCLSLHCISSQAWEIKHSFNEAWVLYKALTSSKAATSMWKGFRIVRDASVQSSLRGRGKEALTLYMQSRASKFYRDQHCYFLVKRGILFQ